MKESFDKIKRLCPWRHPTEGSLITYCLASSLNCSRENCAPYWFSLDAMNNGIKLMLQANKSEDKDGME